MTRDTHRFNQHLNWQWAVGWAATAVTDQPPDFGHMWHWMAERPFIDAEENRKAQSLIAEVEMLIARYMVLR